MYGVADRLLRDPPHQRGARRGQVGHVVHLEHGGGAGRLDGREQVVQGALEAHLGEVRRVDLHEQRPQRAQALAHGVADVLDHLGPDRLGARGARQREGRAGEVLHHAVVQVARDPPPLGVGGLDRGPQQSFARLRVAAQPPAQPPGERRDQQGEHGGPDHRHRAERPGQLGLALVDVGQRDVALEQQGLTLGRADPGVHLDRLAEATLELVLRLVEVGDLGVGSPVLEDGPLVVARGRTACRRAAARRSTRWCRPRATASPGARPRRRGARGRGRRASVAVPASWVTRPRGMAGCTTAAPSTRFTLRASAIASRCAARDPSHAVSEVTSRNAMSSAAATWVTGCPSMRRIGRWTPLRSTGVQYGGAARSGADEQDGAGQPVAAGRRVRS